METWVKRGGSWYKVLWENEDEVMVETIHLYAQEPEYRKHNTYWHKCDCEEVVRVELDGI